jgi:predicted secreted protein
LKAVQFPGFSSDNDEEEKLMVKKKIFCAFIMILVLGVFLWAGDTAVFADLGFSPDGRVYMFGQYGVESVSLKPWAELFVVDVPKNNFVANGKVSYVHNVPVVASQDGSGALFKIIAGSAALAGRYNIDYCFQGQPLYIALNGQGASPGESIEFRDFESGASYRASLVSSVEGEGESLKSSFYIDLERTGKTGARKAYIVGSPQIKRPLVASYRIRKVMIAPHDGSMILVIEMKKQNGAGFDIRYMVEALRL